MTTYGEQLLAKAEHRARARTARRRVVTLLIPGLFTIGSATVALINARLERADGVVSSAGAIAFPALWAIAFVALPLFAAVKADPMPSGAALSFAAGPVLTPMLFGPGGWGWQSVVMFVICGLVLAATAARAGRAGL